MARALADILTEISATYNPLRDRAQKFYDKGVESTTAQEQADTSGLEAAKKNAFESIDTGANRRGMLFSGIPLAEQGKYVGETYLPSIAGLKNRYAGIRGNLYQTLAQTLGGYDTEAANKAQSIYQQELDRDEQIRQFNAQLAAQAAASRASSGGGGGVTFGGGGVINRGATGGQVAGEQTTLRQQWQKEANAGDWNAQVALNYAGDDGRYDGAVNSQAEYNILKSMGISGNYYVVPKASGGGGGGGGW